jgi:hypothetical protein
MSENDPGSAQHSERSVKQNVERLKDASLAKLILCDLEWAS